MHADEPVCVAPHCYHSIFHRLARWLRPRSSAISPVPEDPEGQSVPRRQHQLESLMLLSRRTTNIGPHMSWIQAPLLSPSTPAS